MDNKKMAALNEMELENVNGGLFGFDDLAVAAAGSAIFAIALYVIAKFSE